MSDRCPTTKVVSDNEQGFFLINTSDFNPEVHTLYEEPASEAPQPDAAKPADTGTTPVVTKFKKA